MTEKSKRNLYRLGYNNNRGRYYTAHILAFTDGEAIEKFRELFPQVEESNDINVALIARDIERIIV